MGILHKALNMLEAHALCDHCLGRQFALLGHGIENDERGHALKQTLVMKAHDLALSGNKKGSKVLNVLATNGFSRAASEVLEKTETPDKPEHKPDACFLCENRFDSLDDLAGKALSLLVDYEYENFLVGTELPVPVAEREDEFRARFDVDHGENLKNEFGRVIGKKIAEISKKPVEFRKPDIVVLVNPFAGRVEILSNPLFVAGRYRKLVRGIPQSKWFCSNCRGKGCEKCNWTGKMYPESVQEIIDEPFLRATDGTQSSFHASGREDIDVRMLGNGRPFVLEITKPRRRFLDLRKLEKEVNRHGKGKVKVSGLKPADRALLRELKRGETKQKEYHVVMEFENRITPRDLRTLKERLTNALILQKTPLRVLHRRADLTREKYIYEVNVKKLSPNKAEMRIRCQGGLYVKELVTGDEGRTANSVSEILNNKAKPLKLDVLNVIMEE
jgi:tRNA pseudouridine synthase 10